MNETPPPHASRAHFVEFVVLMAMSTALAALSIDAMLPALGSIGEDLGVERANDVQLVVSLLFLGMAAGQIAYGPLSDRLGRRPAFLLGLALYMAGCLFSLSARTFAVMLAGRLLQGLGAAGPRVVTIALIRDRYEGRLMARVMSLVTAVFIVVPIVAPAMGQAILLVASWRAIFASFLGIALVVTTWFVLRQPETLPAERRVPLSFARVGGGLRETLSTRVSLGYTLALGSVFGAFIGYLSTAQQVFQEQYGLGRLFPLVFAVLALSIGSASLLNARLVMIYGMKRLTRSALLVIVGLSSGFFGISYLAAGHPPLWALMAYLLVIFFCQGTLVGNLNALAMGPLGHIAGLGAAVVGSLSLLISIAGGTLIGQAYDGTILPLVAGFGLLGTASLAAARWAGAERRPLRASPP